MSVSPSSAATRPAPERWPWGATAALGLLFALGLALRWPAMGGDFFGDEAWYLYLARTWGTEPGAQAEMPWFHLANRPAYFAVFHLSSYAGLAGFRLMGCVVGALVPVLAYAAARALGARRMLAALAPALLVGDGVLLEFSSHPFPDMLATACALGAFIAAARGRGGWMAAAALGAVLSKESFFLVPVVAAAIRAQAAGRRVWQLDRAAALTVAAALAYVTAVMLAGRIAGMRMQGWSADSGLPNWIWGTPPLLLCVVGWLAVRRQWLPVVVWLALPAFYVGWILVLGRGWELWYATGPKTFAIVACAAGLEAMWRDALAGGRWRQAGAAVVAGLAVVAMADTWAEQARAIKSHYVGTDNWWWRADTGAAVREIIARERTDDVLVVNCFWAYRYSHLRGPGRPGTYFEWHGEADTPRLRELLGSARLVVVSGEEPTRLALQQLLARAGSELLLDTREWLVVRPATAARRTR